MARRFGGRFSPQPREEGRDRGLAPDQVRHPLQSRTRWITLMAAPLLLSAFWQDPAGLVTQFAGFAAIASGMWLTREGLQAEAAYDARRVARRPAVPRKLFGALLTGLGLALGAHVPGALAGAAVIGVAGAVLHWLAFGSDPLRDKGMAGLDGVQQDRARRVVGEGEAHLAAMQQAILHTGDRRLEARVAVFAATARELFAHIEDDPDSIAALRRYLGVYLQGASAATVKFSELYARGRDARARQDYESLLDDLEREFAARIARLREGGRSDLDIEIGVLRERLAREGLAPAAEAAPRPMTMDDLLMPRPGEKQPR
ncbi:5-bromo-4-chloroindolyl phosphate hydrolysis family protein [Paracoccus sp. (in: a-proteobacteria)]|uniref:5-bromo-4-chloroindolyl phosphate hydrolysis family protein n=1 Tax=Paracoccus sp. TaxID=267 RepID=UPI00321FC32F